MMEYGLNTAWADLRTYEAIAGLGFTIVRIGMHTGTGNPDAIDHAKAAGLTPLVIVKNAEQVASLRERLAGCSLELWNEPDGPVDGRIAPRDYAALVNDFVAACFEAHALPWVGAITNTNESGLAWLSQMFNALPQPLAQNVGVTVHRYPVGHGWSNPHPGFATREAEIDQLRRIIGTRRWGLSEFGYHTAAQLKYKWLPRWFPGNTWAWTDAQVADSVAREWQFWQEQGAAFAVLYQINDGPDARKAEHRFGIRRYDTFDDWKPVARSVRAASTSKVLTRA